MHITLLCTVASSFLVLWSYWSLFVGLRRGKRQPLATRAALCCASLLGFGSIVFGGRAWGDMAFGGVNAVLSVIAVWLTWKSHGSTRVSYVDCACLALSVTGTAAFACARDPAIGAVFAISADCVAFFPAVREIVRKPETQPVRTYFIGCAAAAVALVADKLQGPIGAGSVFTIYLMVIDVLLPIATVGMRAMQRKHREAPGQTTPQEALQNL